MSMYIECINRKLFLQAMLDRNPKKVVIDFSFKESIKHLKDFGEVLLVYRHKSLLDETKCLGLVESFVEFCSQNIDYIDIIEVPNVHPDHYKQVLSLLKSLNVHIMCTVQQFSDDLSYLLDDVKYFGLSSKLTSDEVLKYLNKHKAYLQSFGCSVHVFSKYSKELLLSGLVDSFSSSAWTVGAKNGTTYDYVGNFKMSTYHGSKGQGKDVRKRFKSRCLKYDIDYGQLLSDDTHTVNCWNLQQFLLLANDIESRSYNEKPKTENSLVVQQKKDEHSLIETKNNKTSIAQYDQTRAYSRNCNSCYLSDMCPAFVVDAQCSINTRPELNNHNDYKDLLDRVIELQSERVFFAAFAEKTQNAGLNPEVSQEIEKLTSVMKDAKNILSASESEVTIRAKGSGVISQIFGTYGRSGGGSKPSQSEKIIDVSPMESDDDE